MADIIKPEYDFGENVGGGGQTYYYNRDRSSSLIEIIAGDFIFKNYPDGSSGSITLDKNIYPYVKIDGEFFINDGEAWEYTDGNKTASMLHKTSAYQWGKNKPDSFRYIPISWTEKTEALNNYTNSVVVSDNSGKDIDFSSIPLSVGAFQKIPFYYAGDAKQSYMIWVNKDNLTTLADDTQDGRFIFKDNINYNGVNSKNLEFWGEKPSIYPEIVLNTMEKPYAVASTSCNFSLNADGIPDKIYLKENNRDLGTIDIGPSDIVIYYNRSITTPVPFKDYTFTDSISESPKNDKVVWHYFKEKPTYGARYDKTWEANVPVGWQIFVDRVQGSPEMGIYYSPDPKNSNAGIDCIFSSSKTTRFQITGKYIPTYQDVGEYFKQLWKEKDVTLTYLIKPDKDNLYARRKYEYTWNKYTFSYVSIAQGGVNGYKYDPLPEDSAAQYLTTWKDSLGRDRSIQMRGHGKLYYLGTNSPRETITGTVTTIAGSNSSSGVQEVRLKGSFSGLNGCSTFGVSATISGLNFGTNYIDFIAESSGTTGTAYVIWRNGVLLSNQKTYFTFEESYGYWSYAKIHRYQKKSDGTYDTTPTESITLNPNTSNGFKTHKGDKLVIEPTTTQNMLCFYNGTREFIVNEPPFIMFLKTLPHVTYTYRKQNDNITITFTTTSLVESKVYYYSDYERGNLACTVPKQGTVSFTFRNVSNVPGAGFEYWEPSYGEWVIVRFKDLK